MKINNDKYYTPVELANYCWEQAIAKIGFENINDIIEPSCGNGSFLQYNIIPRLCYDISPECQSNVSTIITGDFLLADIEYQPKRLIIGNPPYGRCLNMAQKFYEKSVEIADYIAFILPISQLNNTQSMYKFDLIHSEDLGKRVYTDRELHCCFNIYERPNNGLNSKPNKRLKDISICRQDSRQYDNFDYDIRMCYWGDGSAGKILSENEHYSAEYKIRVNNPLLREKIINVLNTYDWAEYLNCIAMRKIQQFHIYDVLRKEIPNIN